MEVLLKYGNKDQKREWLQPLLDGKIRSAFLMTEPQVASSDATNIAMNMRREGDEWVLNGQVSHFVESSCLSAFPHSFPRESFFDALSGMSGHDNQFRK